MLLSSVTSLLARLRLLSANVLHVAIHHVHRHVGVGIVCAVAYFDPGNWSVDLQAGSNFGYRPMLFVLLMAGLGAMVLQTLACKLGCVTGLDLASHCRLLLHDRPKHTRSIRWLLLYPLYVLSEIAIISTDLAELLGSAIGICLLFPQLPLWASVVLTATDVLIFLLFADPTRGYGRPARVFELVIVLLVLAVFSCFLVLLVKVKPYWSEVFLGYLPSKGLFQTHPDAVYSAVGILGATVMPHALFLGSSLAAQDRVSLAPPEVARLPGASPPRPTTLWARAKAFCAPLFRVTRAERVAAAKDYRTRYGARENNSLTFIRQHLTHGIVDVVTSLLGVAVPINSAILILSATVFFEGPDDHDHPTETPAGLFEAYDLIKAHMGHGAATIFALALVCAGQASSITATLAGQIVSEGFIEWRVSPFLRRLVTRLISLIPAVVVALAVGRDGINTLLIASQVALSVVLPFIALPLIYLTSSRVVMRVGRREVREAHDAPERDGESVREVDVGVSTEVEVVVEVAPPEVGENRPIAEKAEAADVEGDEMVDYSNGWVLLGVAYAIWGVVLVANVYAIVSLGMRTGSA